MTPQKYPQNLHTPKNINFSDNPKKYWNSKFWTQKNDPSLRMYENITEYSPPPAPTPPPRISGNVFVCFVFNLGLNIYWVRGLTSHQQLA